MKQFTSLLASANVGVARIDTRLRTSVLIPGELVQGHVFIHGGAAAQTIDAITLSVTTQCTREADDATPSETYILASQRLTNGIQVDPKERKVLPFAIPLPDETPLTLGRQRISLHTIVGSASTDSKYTEMMHIRPHPAQRQVLDALARLRFQLTGVKCRYQPLPGHVHPIIQELEFLPIGGYRHAFEEIAVIFEMGEHGLEVLIEIKGRARGLCKQAATAYDLDERYTRIYVPHTDLDQTVIDGMIEQILGSVSAHTA
jgi:sporulation-control protein